MKPSRRVELWLADRHPRFDRPSLYRRDVRPPSLDAGDQILVLLACVPVLGIGLLAVGVGVLVLVAALTVYL